MIFINSSIIKTRSVIPTRIAAIDIITRIAIIRDISHLVFTT